MLASAARVVAAAMGTVLPPATRLAAVAPVDVPPLPADVEPAPELIGMVHEALLDGGARRRAGAHYTPRRVAERLVAIALEGLSDDVRVCDPACGGGAFLVAAARALAAGGRARAAVLDRLCGVDLDPIALAATEASLALWAGDDAARAHLIEADGLELDAASMPPFDAVVGNPPFLNQLERATVRQRASAARLQAIYGDAARAYADTASLFVPASLRLVRPGGRVVLIQPLSFLAARDGRGARQAALAHGALEGLWVAGERIFNAAVHVCAPVLRAGAPQPTQLRQWRGAAVDELPPRPLTPDDISQLQSGRTWSPFTQTGVAQVDISPSATPVRRVGDVATATAGFRDQFYGFVPFAIDEREVDDERAFPRLITSGLIEPGRVAWGERPARFAKRRFQFPRIDLAALRWADPTLARWTDDRLVPKLVVATQTRVVECAVDEAGTWVPLTPVIALHAPPADLWKLAAALLAPPVTAWALRTYGGTALSTDALKLAARQLLEAPLPSDEDAWTEATALLRANRLTDAGRRLCPDDELYTWWTARLPRGFV